MRKFLGSFVFWGMLCFLFNTSLVYGADYSKEELLRRIEKLEQEIQMLKSQLNDVSQAVSESSTAVGSQAGAKQGSKYTIVSSIPLELYGYIKVDAVYSDSGGSVGNSALQMNAASESGTDNDKFVIDGRETRIGLKLDGVELEDGGVVSGKIETDFWGDSTGSSTRIRLRQAFIKLSYPKWSVLGGQTWDFFSPLGPATLNFGYLWRAGNLGDRHPQIIFTRKLTKTLTAKVGMIDSENADQENSGGPVGGVYVSYKKDKLYLGVGGIYGQEDVTGKDVPIWAGVFSWQYKLTPKITLKGEGYYGSTLNSFRGGGATGTYGTSTNMKGVRARGGWAQVSLKATKKLTFNLGGGIDDIVQHRISSSIWDYNYTYFLNLKYKIAKNLIWGIEYQHFKTEYEQQAGGDANRLQTSLIYKF